MSSLTFVLDPQTYNEDTVTTKQLFMAVMGLMHRTERLEIVAGTLANILLSVTSDAEPPTDKFEAACTMLEDFLRDLKEELDVHHQVRAHLDFLNQAE